MNKSPDFVEYHPGSLLGGVGIGPDCHRPARAHVGRSGRPADKCEPELGAANIRCDLVVLLCGLAGVGIDVDDDVDFTSGGATVKPA